MNTFKEFYAAVKSIAAGRYCAIEVKATSHGEIEWSGYIDGPGWTAAHNKQFPADPKDPAAVLESLRQMKAAWTEPVFDPDPDPAVEDVGEVSLEGI